MLSTICKNQTNNLFYNYPYIAAFIFGRVIVHVHFDHICTLASFLVLFMYFINHRKTDRDPLCTFLACAGSRKASRRDHSLGLWPEDQSGTFCPVHVVHSKPKITSGPPPPPFHPWFQPFQDPSSPYVTPFPSLVLPETKFSKGIYHGGAWHLEEMWAQGIFLFFLPKELKNDSLATP